VDKSHGTCDWWSVQVFSLINTALFLWLWFIVNSYFEKFNWWQKYFTSLFLWEILQIARLEVLVSDVIFFSPRADMQNKIRGRLQLTKYGQASVQRDKVGVGTNLYVDVCLFNRLKSCVFE
jgi:hypothetical protein